MHSARPARTLPMAGIDHAAPVQFLKTAFEPEDWVAVFLKSYDRSSVPARGITVPDPEPTVSAMAAGDELPTKADFGRASL